jgi:LmbE family N-acetylglucosaminyl deacetylase
MIRRVVVVGAFGALCALSVVGCGAAGPETLDPSGAGADLSDQRIMLVLAHPDDETMIGPLLIALQERHATVMGIYATHGEGGGWVIGYQDGVFTKRKDFTPDQLADERRMELGLAAKEYGIEPVRELDAKDDPMRGTDPTKDNFGKPSHDLAAFEAKGIWTFPVLEAEISEAAADFDPTVVISMSSDSENHIHHQAVRKIASVLFRRHALGAATRSLYAIEPTDGEQVGVAEPRGEELTFHAERTMARSDETYTQAAVHASQRYTSQEVAYLPDTASRAAIYLVDGEPLDDADFGWLRH